VSNRCGYKTLARHEETMVGLMLPVLLSLLVPKLVEEVVHVLLAVHGDDDSVQVLLRLNPCDLLFLRSGLDVDELLPLLQSLVELGVEAPGCYEKQDSAEMNYVVPVHTLN